MSPDQAVKTRKISDVAFSPDGKRVVCVVSGPVRMSAGASHIWVLHVDQSGFRQFTFSSKSETTPLWSPDSRILGFLSDREEHSQIYLLPADGGEAFRLTCGRNAVSLFRWSPDGSQIAFLAPEPTNNADERDPKIIDSEQDLDRLWVVDVGSKQVRQLTGGNWRIQQIEWASNEQIFAIATDEPRAESWNYAIYSIAITDGSFTLFTRPNQPFGGLTISPDRAYIAFVAAGNGGPIPHNMFIQSTAGGPARDVTASINRAIVRVMWENGATALASVTDGFRYRIYRVPVQGAPEIIELPYSTGDFDIARDGNIAFVGFGFDRLPELYMRSADGSVIQVSHLHQDWAGISLAKAELFHFRSFDNREIEAALMKPARSPENATLPLILYVHGGPASNFTATYLSWAQLLVAHGYQILMVNPRGSSGYGEEFLKANRGDWGGGDFKDLMSAIDLIVSRGETDANRLGIAGWSYGGYMAEWAITQTPRFKAAVSGAGMFDLAAEFETEIEPADDEWYFGTPWQHPDLFARDSPYIYIQNAKTPTLILQGEHDVIDPLGQSAGLYRALKRYGVETELVVYPREPHGPGEEKHQIDILRRVLGWFDKYLGQSR